jgi:DNA repair protein RadA/Sms
LKRESDKYRHDNPLSIRSTTSSSSLGAETMLTMNTMKRQRWYRYDVLMTMVLFIISPTSSFLVTKSSLNVVVRQASRPPSPTPPPILGGVKNNIRLLRLLLGKTPTMMTRMRAMNEEYDDDDDDDDDEEPPDVDVRNFQVPSEIQFGLGRGRSSPSQRKAMGTSSKKSTTVFVCTNCGSESIQWRGQCPTCKSWNTYQEFAVQRDPTNDVFGLLGGGGGSSSSGGVGGSAHNLLSRHSRNVAEPSPGRPVFRTGNSNNNNDVGKYQPQSWLDGIPGGSGGGFGPLQVSYDNQPVPISKINLESSQESRRIQVPDDDEINSVLGGGLMKGSLLLLGGEPGVGKSTFALQVAAQVASLSSLPVKVGMGPSTTSPASAIGPVWYISGEETLEQIATRAQRLAPSADSLPSQLFLLSETNLNVLADQVVQTWIDSSSYTSYAKDQEQQGLDSTAMSGVVPPPLPPSLLIIDSIQTMVCESGGSSSAGGITQVRESMALLLRLAKTTRIPILTIGHVTKSGDVAGPRMVEHMVDAVLYLEQSRQSNYRFLRAQKNRFGTCETVGLYEFNDGLLVPLPEGTDASLAPPSSDVEGMAMAIVMEGQHRALTVEVQGLVTGTASSFGKKTVEGIPMSRLAMLLGILQKHCGIAVAGSGRGISRDVYVNVVGCAGMGSKSQQSLAATALDLAVIVSLTSSHLRIPVRGDTIFLAQVGLLGELRPLQFMEARLQQAQRMGFSRVITAVSPQSSMSSSFSKIKKKQLKDGEDGVSTSPKFGLDVIECSKLQHALDRALVSPLPKSRPKSRATDSRPNNRPEHNKGEIPFSTSPGSLQELYLEEDVILDDEDDEDDDIG